MSKSRIVRGAKGVSVVAATVLLTASVGSASAAPSTVASEGVDASAPVVATTIAAPTSWRGSAVEAGTVASATTAVAPARQPSRAISARQAVAASRAKFTNFTLHSKATKDMRGVEPSLYRGKYYRAAIEPKRRCIAQRESEGHYDVVNPSGAYRGAYQVSASLARGATWMMLKEHEKLMGEQAAKKVLAQLRAKPMNTWPRYWQDAAFHTVANWKHTGSGIAHWAGGRWHC
jgi:hypothetical protein